MQVKCMKGLHNSFDCPQTDATFQTLQQPAAYGQKVFHITYFKYTVHIPIIKNCGEGQHFLRSRGKGRVCITYIT